MFCPMCGNILFVEEQCGIIQRACRVCPVSFPITKTTKQTTYYQGKALDELILGQEQAWKNCEQTAERCPKCEHPEAYFVQLQTRSADEPMTIFYRCCNHDCSHTWRSQ